ncbi:juvenile hormone esterase-like [Aricia agestis]|uniref:juvenile hormone esterase-like n=1 Tax=Aricia agestis TaxID=91739 RepID=UPI001C201F0E|nr:juvenile hormone esterase-like [Aricia agestis]
MLGFLYVLFLSSVLAEDVSRVVVTSQGAVRGYKDKDHDLFAFYNIPYATAPTGTNRFRAPEPAPTWTDTFEAVNQEIVCPQSEFILKHFSTKKMKENCLISSVYVPDTDQTNLPVYVIVHGGGFAFGYGDLNTPKKLVSSKQIIAVTFNYRLGPHGFLCLGTEDVPGNAGMKDQVALLRWVKKNIANFGGNPDDVTIGGGSAGSASVDLLMLSKMAEGLFDKVIPESGASVAPFAIQSDPIECAKVYGKLLGFENVDDIKNLEDQFKSIEYGKLFTDEVVNRTDTSLLMSPCVERDLSQEMFLKEDPVSIIKSGDYRKLPMLYGFANMEGLVRIPNFEDWKLKMENNFSDFLPSDLKFKNDEERERVANEIKTFYFGDKTVSENVLAYVDYFTDVIIAYPILRAAKLQVEAGNDQIYLYEFTYTDQNTPLVLGTNERGASHCAQTLTVLDPFEAKDLNFIVYSVQYEEICRMYRGVWLNFIKTGKPVAENSGLPQWLPVGSDVSPHMSLNHTMELKGPLLKERMVFWDGIYRNHYRIPMPPNPDTYVHSEL